MRGDVDVRGTVEIAVLLLLTVPNVPPPEKTSTLAVPLGSRSLLAVLGSERLQSLHIANP